MDVTETQHPFENENFLSCWNWIIIQDFTVHIFEVKEIRCEPVSFTGMIIQTFSGLARRLHSFLYVGYNMVHAFYGKV
jgi:hypothetical protein